MSVHDDINDVFDGLREERPQDVASISNDSNIGSSLSNFGIDRDNPEENQLYIQQNEDRLAIIQGIGVGIRNLNISEISDSGLATSVSKTVSGEFIPEVIEFEEEIQDTNSDLITAEHNNTVEPQPGPSSGERYGYDPKYDESERLAEDLQELDVSSFDLALEKGYRDQAKIYYDDATSKGLHPKTKHIKPFKEVATEEQVKQKLAEGSLEPDDDFWTEDYIMQRIFNLRKDFEEYLENLEKKEYKKVLEKLVYKKDLNDKEKKIERNIKTKANRNNITLQKETIRMVQGFLQFLIEYKKFIKGVRNKSKEEEGNNREEESSEGSNILPNQNETGCSNSKDKDDDFNEDAAGPSQSST